MEVVELIMALAMYEVYHNSLPGHLTVLLRIYSNNFSRIYIITLLFETYKQLFAVHYDSTFEGNSIRCMTNCLEFHPKSH